jgi:hypothetical protein
MHTYTHLTLENDIPNNLRYFQKQDFKNEMFRKYDVNILDMYSKTIEYNANNLTTEDDYLNSRKSLITDIEDFLQVKVTKIDDSLVLTEAINENLKFTQFERCVIDGHLVNSLHNIHKILLNCKEIHIANQNHVTSHILGLFLTKANKITCSSLSVRVPWWTSFYNHWGMTDDGNDMLECQEELITSGLRHYAKL